MVGLTRTLTRSNTNSNLALTLEVVDTAGWTALHWCARHGQARCAEALMAAGAEPNPRDHQGAGIPLALSLT